MVAARRVAWLLSVAVLLAACRGGKGAADAGDGATPAAPPGTVVTLGPGDDLAAALATAGERAREADQRVYVELYASWSEPALAIHRSMADPRMREAFSRTFVLRVDIDHHRDELEALGYPTSSVPLVVAAGPDGRAGDRHLTSADLTAPTPAAMAPIFERFFHGD